MDADSKYKADDPSKIPNGSIKLLFKYGSVISELCKEKLENGNLLTNIPVAKTNVFISEFFNHLRSNKCFDLAKAKKLLGDEFTLENNISFYDEKGDPIKESTKVKGKVEQLRLHDHFEYNQKIVIVHVELYDVL